MSTRARLTVATAIALVSAMGIGLAVSRMSTGSGRAPPPPWLHETGAGAPFAGYREARIELDGRCRPVAVADTEARRERGLRGRADFGAYAGMLFFYGRETGTAFTMAGVTEPLDIGWYASNGRRVDGARMAACPNRDQAHCPVYRSRGRYRVALETPSGSVSAGSIAPCG